MLAHPRSVLGGEHSIDSGTLPGAAALVEAPAVGDWEKEVARKVLRELVPRGKPI